MLTVCIIVLFLTAGALLLIVRPQGGGAVRQHLLAGTLLYDAEDAGEEESLTLRLDERGNLLLRRAGLAGLTADGALSLAVTVRGFDIDIRERRVEGRRPSEAVNTAIFTLPDVAQERYRFTYRLGDDVAAAFTVTPRHDTAFTARLSR